MATVLEYSYFKLSIQDYRKTVARETVHLTTKTEKKSKKSAKELLKHLSDSQYFPNNNLADEIEGASREFRANFKLKPK